MAHGSLWIKREILRQDLLLLKLKKEKGVEENRTVEQYLTDTIAELDKVCK
jgi:hypothetical protein